MKMEKEKENSDKWKEETVQTYERFLLFIQLTGSDEIIIYYRILFERKKSILYNDSKNALKV